MKAITRLAALALAIAGLSFSAFGANLEGWSTNLDDAIAQAKKENKMSWWNSPAPIGARLAL